MKTTNNILLLVAALLCGACAEDVFVENMPSNEALTITISTEPISRNTRAVEHIGYTDDVVEQNLNENRIRTVDIYMFPSATITDASQISYHLPRITVTDEGDGELGIETISLMINNTVFEAALGGITPEEAITQNKQYYASIIVNQPSDITVEAGETFAQLKAKTTACAQFASGEVVPTFVMTGHATLAVRHDDDANCYVLYNPVSGYITVERCAAKIDIVVDDVEKYIRDEYGNFWKSVPSTLKASFYHGVKKTSLAADLSYEPVMPPTEPHDFFDVTPSRSFVQATAANSPMFDAGDYYTVSDGKHMPYYSYPSLWDGNDFDKRKEAYFLLQMDWQEIKGRIEVDGEPVTAETEGAEAALDSDGSTIYFINDGNADTDPVLTSYQLPITSSFLTNANRFIRNNYYRLCVKVGIIGSFDPGNPEIIINNTYIVADWSKESIDVNMHEAAYLTVNEHERTLNNQTNGYVTYSSSPAATATITKIKFQDFSSKSIQDVILDANGESHTLGTGSYAVPINFSGTNAAFTATAQSDGKIMLNVNIDLTKVYTPFEVAVNVSNGKNPNQTVTFTVYPPIYIEAHASSGNVFVLGNDNSQTRDVYNNNGEWIGRLTQKSEAAGNNMSGNNTNPNIYSIHISSFSANDSYTIGDSRLASIDNNLGNADNIWSGINLTYTWSLTEAESWGSYNSETGTFYYSYAEYNQPGSGITREDNNVNQNIATGPGRNYWGYYTSEANAYGPDADGYYYWRSGRGTGNNPYVYHRTRYYRTGTRYFKGDILTAYHPTNPTDTRDMISPSFIIASSYGKTTYDNTGTDRDMTLERARMRCATYQEDGYPAGRWRLPTYSEVEFIMSLSTSGRIPTLFQMDTPTDAVGYWCANGKVVLRNNVVQLETNNTTPTAPRCVYDLWYWGDEHSTYQTTFHYGDADPRE